MKPTEAISDKQRKRLRNQMSETGKNMCANLPVKLAYTITVRWNLISHKYAAHSDNNE